jgi:hypothetical protein
MGSSAVYDHYIRRVSGVTIVTGRGGEPVTPARLAARGFAVEKGGPTRDEVGRRDELQR